VLTNFAAGLSVKNFYQQPNVQNRPLFSGLMAFAVFFAAGLLLISCWNILCARRTEVLSAPSQNETIRQNLEKLLAEKVQTVLEQIAGKGKIRTEVNIELDFATIATDEEIFDPNGQIIRSYTQSNNFASQVQYEINKLTRSQKLNGIAIKKISAVVLVDSICEKDGDGRLIYRNRSAEEMAKMEALIKPILGFDSKRGDVLKLENIHFAEENRFFPFLPTVGLLILLLIVGGCVVSAMLNRNKYRSEAETDFDINTIIAQNPEAAAELIRKWLNEDKS